MRIANETRRISPREEQNLDVELYTQDGIK